MKIFVALAWSLSLSTAALAAGSNIAKLPDGKFARCASAKDIGHISYLPSDLQANLDRGNLTLDFTVSNLICAQNEKGEFAWAANAQPLAPSDSTDLDGRPITIFQANAEFLLTKSRDLSVMGSVAMADQDQQSLSFGFTLEQSLTAEQLAAFENGGKVDLRLNFFQRSEVTVQTADGKKVPLGRRAGGAYVITLSFQKARDGEAQTVEVSFK